MTLAATSYLDAFKAAADHAEATEGQFRREAAQRIAALERERAFAYRRLNLVRTITEALTGVETEEIAVANAQAVLRSRLGWSADSEARTEVLARFASVAQAGLTYNVNSRTVRRCIADGLITGYRVGGRLVKVDLDEIDERVVKVIPAAHASR